MTRPLRIYAGALLLLMPCAAFLHPSLSSAKEQEAESVPEDKCIVELNLPKGTEVSVDGRDYGAAPELTFDGLQRGKLYSSKVHIRSSKGKSEERSLLLRGGWRLAVAPSLPPVRLELMAQAAPQMPVRAALFDEDGQYLLCVQDGQLMLSETSTGRLVRTMAARYGGILSVAFKKGTPQVVVAGCGPGELGWSTYDFATGSESDVHRVAFPARTTIESGAICIKSQLLLLGCTNPPDEQAGELQVLDMRTGEKVQSIRIPIQSKAPIAVSPNEELALIGNGWGLIGTGFAVLVDLATYRTIRNYPVSGMVNSVAFSGDGQSVFIELSHRENRKSTTSVTVWGLQADAPRTSILIPDNLASAAFSFDGKKILTSSSNVVQKTSEVVLWDAFTGQRLGTVGQDTDRESPVAISRDGQQLFGHSALWDAVTLAKQCTVGKCVDGLEAVHVSDHGTLLIASRVRDESLPLPQRQGLYDGDPHVRFILRDLASGRNVSARTIQDGKHSILLSPDRTLAIACSSADDGKDDEDDTYVLWNVSTGLQRQSFTEWPSKVSFKCFSPDNRYILGEYREPQKSSDTMWTMLSRPRVGMWDLQTGQRVVTFQGEDIEFISHWAAMSRDGQRLLMACAGKEAMRDPDGNPDGQAAVLWDVGTGKRLLSLGGHRFPVMCGTFSQDGQQVATGTGGLKSVGRWRSEVVLWNAVTGQRLHNLEGSEGHVGSLSFSQDGALLIATSGVPMDVALNLSQVNVWDTASGALLRRWEEIGTQGIRSAHFLENDRIVVAEYSDQMRIYDLATGEELGRLVSLDGGKDWLLVTPEGLFDGSEGGRQNVVYRMSNSLQLIPVDRFFQDFYRPGLLIELLHGNRERPEAALGQALPPKVRLVAPKAGWQAESPKVTLEIEVEDQNGGINGPWIKQNGARLLAEGQTERRGRIIRGQFEVTLVEGNNLLEVWAASADGSWESEPARLLLHYNRPLPRPELYLLAVGIDEYAEESVRLRFAADDARAMADVFAQRGSGLYAQVHACTLLDAQATRSGILQGIRSLATQARPQDTVVIFLAGQGRLAGQQYCFLPQDWKPTDTGAVPGRHGLSAAELGEALASIRSLRRIMVFDTGHSGVCLGDRRTARNPFAFRGSIERLSRAEGAFTLASLSLTKDVQESPALGHGLLSYTLLAGLHAVDEGPLKDAWIEPASEDRVAHVLEWFSFASTRLLQLNREYHGQQQDVQCKLAGAAFPLLPMPAATGRSQPASSPPLVQSPPSSPPVQPTSAAPSHGAASSGAGRLLLVAVGINGYTEEGLKLGFARDDARAMANLFRQRGPDLYSSVQVREVLDSQATRAGVLAALEAVAAEARPEDTLAVFLAGHGKMLGQRYYFLPCDFHRKADSIEDDVRQSGLAADVLADVIAKVRAQRRLLILDTCASGGALGLGKGHDSFAFRDMINQMGQRQSVFTLAASASGAEAQEIPELHHGALTYALLAGLGAVDTGPLAGQRLHATTPDHTVHVFDWFSYAASQVPKVTKKYLDCEQDVQLGGEGDSFPILPLSDH